MSEPHATPTASSPPAGWYPDPHDPTKWRFWDGDEWSAFGSGDGLAVERLDEGASTDAAPMRARFLAFVVGVGLVSLATGFAVVTGGDTDDESADPFSVAVDQTSGDPDDAGDPDEVWEDPALQVPEGWEADLGPLAIVYRVETNNGEEFERVVATDHPRSVFREEDNFVLYDRDESVQCFRARCVAQPGEPRDQLAQLRTMLPPHEGDDPFTRRIAGREAVCTTNEVIDSTTCMDVETGLILLIDPGDDAMRPSAFTSQRITAVEIRSPNDEDFELPEGASFAADQGDDS